MRVPTLVLALLVPSLFAFATAPAAAAAPAFEMELLTPPVGAGQAYRVLYRDIEWRPNGDYALIVGGIRGPSHNPCAGWSFVMQYDGANFQVLRNESGCMLFALSWAPDGSHALMVGERNTILKWDAVKREFKDIWGASEFAAAGESFHPRSVAYRPAVAGQASYALVTGNDLLRFYPELNGIPDVLAPGSHRQGEFFDSVAWSPDGMYALLEAGVTDVNGTRALGMVSVYSEDAQRCQKYSAPAAPCVYPHKLYGRFDPGFTDIDGVTFGPLGKVAWVYGLDGGHGSIMRYGEAEDDFSYPYEYYHRNGRISGMSWQPNSYKVLYTAYGNAQLVLSEGWRFTTLLDNADCGVRWPTKFATTCPNLKEAAWHPSGAYALVIASVGYVFRYTPLLAPTVSIESPANNANVAGDSANVRGFAYAQQTNRVISDVQWRLAGGDWSPAIVGTPRLATQWNFTLPLAGLDPGSLHTLEVRASDDNRTTWGPPAESRFFVRHPDASVKHPTLVLVAANGTSVENGFTLTWSEVPNATYIVQRSREPTFFTTETLYSDDARLTFPAHAKGTFHFRVQARGGLSPGDWSNAVAVTVTVGPDRSAGLDPDQPDLIPNPTDDQNPAPNRTTPNNTAPPQQTNLDRIQSWFQVAAPGLLALAAAAAAAVVLGARRR